MSIWYAIPSIRQPAEAITRLGLWADRGYNIALLRQGKPLGADLEIPTGEYLGWARSTNILVKRILEIDPAAEWIVGGGDDYEPDLAHTAQDIADRCEEYFLGIAGAALRGTAAFEANSKTFGIMQPTGDRWGDDPASRARYGEDRGAYIDRICGSPWMGREWCKRAYQGHGPMFEGYHHYYADEELQEVAQGLGVLWQRRDLIQLHRHWGRIPGGADESDVPDWYRANVTPDWGPSQALFNERKAAGFPGSDPL